MDGVRMNVTLRPDGRPDDGPDLYYEGRPRTLKNLEDDIRTLLTARRWLIRELAHRKKDAAA
jgi:hypothetical protein